MKLSELKLDVGAPLFEMANLTSKYTGFDKIIRVSTAEGSHAPRVKIYYKPGKDNPSTSISIGDNPEKIEGADSLNPTSEEIAQVIKFVKLNKEALLKFWYHGTDMTQDEVDEMFATLHKI